MCRVAQDNSWNMQILKPLTTAVCCFSVCVVVHGRWGETNARWGETNARLGVVNATINERWGETNNRIGAPFTLLCWSLGIYLLSKSGKVNRDFNACAPFSDNLAGF